MRWLFLTLFAAPADAALLPPQVALLRTWLVTDGVPCGEARQRLQDNFGVLCPTVAFDGSPLACLGRLAHGCTDACAGTSWYPDADGDGYGDPGSPRGACTAPPGHVADASDCDDADPATNPGGVDVCAHDGDRDCDGIVACAAAQEGAAYVGDTSNLLLGAALASGGDLDGDGAADLLMSGIGASSMAGAVYVGPRPAASTDTSTLATVLAGAQRDDRLGEVLAAGGDLDGDGAYDFVVASRQSGEGGELSGAAWLYAGPRSGALTTADADGVLLGIPYQEAPSALHLGVDATGDGLDDLALGTALRKTYSQPGTAGIVGADPWTTRTMEEVKFLVRPRGAMDSLLGQAVTLPGDVDGDGVGDFATSVANVSSPSPGDPGVVCLFAGPVSGEATLEDCDATWTGVGPTGQFGAVLAPGGDFDGDGLPELLVGGWVSGAPGGAWVLAAPLAGDASEADAWASIGQSDPTYLGFAVASGDLDGDGAQDLAVGDPYAEEPDRAQGAVYVYAGLTPGAWDTSAATVAFFAETEDDLLGYSVLAPGDLDGSGCPELVMGGIHVSAGARYGGVVLFEELCGRM